MTNDDLEPIEDLNYMTNDYIRKKYSPLRLWKWWIILFEWTLVIEVLVTIIFWTTLYSPKTWATFTPGFKMQNCFEHGLIVCFLLVEWCLNAVPFCWRHLVFVNAMMVLYLLETLIIALVTSNAVYPPLSWRNGLSWASLVVMPALVSLIFSFFKIITDWKLARNGFHDAVMVMKDELHIRKSNNIVEL